MVGPVLLHLRDLQHRNSSRNYRRTRILDSIRRIHHRAACFWRSEQSASGDEALTVGSLDQPIAAILSHASRTTRLNGVLDNLRGDQVRPWNSRANRRGSIQYELGRLARLPGTDPCSTVTL